MSKRPAKETNQLAKYILEVTPGETEKIEPPEKNPHAQAFSKTRGVQAAKLAQRSSDGKRNAIAKKAAKARGA